MIVRRNEIEIIISASRAVTVNQSACDDRVL